MQIKNIKHLLINMLNYDFILKKAAESKIDNIIIEKEYWQLLFLQRLYFNKDSERIFFKGGTAIRFLLNSFRFSEDLDFTATLSKKSTEEILLDVFHFFEKNSIGKLEFKKEKVFEKFAEESLRYRFLFFPRGLKQKASIRIDVSFREKPIMKETTVLVPFDYPISPYPLTVHLAMEEIFAEKIRAMFVRRKPRDLFDVWFLLTKKVPINEEIIKKKFSIYPKLKFNIKKLKETIHSFDDKELKKDLNQFLPEHYRIFYQVLKKETLKLLPS